MDKVLTRYNKSIISIGNLALMNKKYDFKNEINYSKFIRFKRSKDLYNHLIDEDIYVSQNKQEIREILNKISFE